VAREILLRSVRAALIVLAALVVLLPLAVPARAADDYPHLLLGNPSQATANKAKQDNYLVKKDYYALSYNNTNGNPNWGELAT